MAFDTNLAFKIAAQVVGAEQIKGLSRDVTALRVSASGVETAFKSAGNIVKGFAAAFSVQALMSFSKSIIDMADGLKEASKNTGVAVGDLSKLKATAESAGVGFDSLQSALKKLNVNISDAAGGSKPMLKAFEAIGISAKGLKDLKADEALGKMADAFSMTEDGANKVRIATTLLGRSGSELIAFLNEGSDGLKKFGAELSDQFVEDADKFNDSLKILQNTTQTFGASLVGLVIQPLSLAFVFWANKIDGFGVSFQKFIRHFKDLKNVFDFKDASKNAMSLAAEDRKAEEEFQKRQQGRYTSFFKPADDLKVKIKSPGIGSDDARKESEKRQKEIEKEEKALKSYVATKKEAIDLLALESEKIKYTEYEYAVLVETRKHGAQVEKESLQYTDARLTAYQKEAAELLNMRLHFMALQEEQEKSYGAGARKAMQDYVREASRGAKMMESAFKGAFSRLEDSLVDFVKTGKFNFKDLADFIVTEMIRISVRQAVIAPILGAIGSLFSGASSGTASSGTMGSSGSSYGFGNSYQFANGGIMSSFGSIPLKEYSNGGIASSPQMAIFGEGSTPEAYVPLPDGKRIPVAMSGGGGGMNTNVSVVVNMNGDSEKSDVAANTKFGEGLGKVISSIVKQEMLLQRRPGGILT